MTGILATDGWAVTFGKCEEKPERAAAPPSPLLTLPNVTGHPSTTSVPTSHHSMWQYNYLRTLKGSTEINCPCTTQHSQPPLLQ